MIQLEDMTFTVTNLVTKNEVNNDGVVLPNAVCQTQWKAEYTDEDGCTGFFAGATPFSASNLSEEEFMQLDTLTEEVVIGWIKGIIDEKYLNHISGMILRQIDQENRTDQHLPWKPVEEEANDPDQ